MKIYFHLVCDTTQPFNVCVNVANALQLNDIALLDYNLLQFNSDLGSHATIVHSRRLGPYKIVTLASKHCFFVRSPETF